MRETIDPIDEIDYNSKDFQDRNLGPKDIDVSAQEFLELEGFVIDYRDPALPEMTERLIMLQDRKGNKSKRFSEIAEMLGFERVVPREEKRKEFESHELWPGKDRKPSETIKEFWAREVAHEKQLRAKAKRERIKKERAEKAKNQKHTSAKSKSKSKSRNKEFEDRVANAKTSQCKGGVCKIR
jgi:hypothetical protein